MLAALLAGLLTWYTAASVRTTYFGNDEAIRLLVVTLLLTAWCCAIPFAGWPAHRLTAAALGLFLAAFAAALIWASVEEALITHAAPAEDLVIAERWWPFTHHVLVYSPQRGWFAQD